ncbi:ribosome-inactivating family protein [Flavobacterium sp.]|uniref:ribosome-inactivating family protein n=1 Tax=Flavobacterium sp. TaxID=239 RepID=UPI003753410A
MVFNLRLEKRAFYLTDLKQIINFIKANGVSSKCQIIQLSHPIAGSIKLYLNFVLEQNPNNSPNESSIAILGFKISNNNEFKFKKVASDCDLFSKECNNLKIDGSYISLGYPFQLPKVSDFTIQESIKSLNNLKKGKKLSKLELDAIAILSIVTSESIRFSSVATGICNVIENNTVFIPNSFEIIGWGKHSIAS